jgi:hypothetical protein
VSPKATEEGEQPLSLLAGLAPPPGALAPHPALRATFSRWEKDAPLFHKPQ